MKKTLRLSALVLALLFVFTLVACAPKDQKAAKEKLEKAGYTVAVDGTIIPAALKILGVDGVDTVITAAKSEESIVAIYFAEKADVKEAYSKVEEYAKKNAKDPEVKKAGNWIYYGTAQAVKDFA